MLLHLILPLDSESIRMFRDGPLEKLWGGGIFEPHEFVFVTVFLVCIFLAPLYEYFLG